MWNMIRAIDVLWQLMFNAKPPGAEYSLWSDLYIQAMSGQLLDTPLIEDTLLSIKRYHSGRMLATLMKLISELKGSHMDGAYPRIEGLDEDFGCNMDELEGLKTELQDLLESLDDDDDDDNYLRSGYDLQHSTVRTTVVAQKVGLSNEKVTLSKEEEAYTKIVDEINIFLKEYFQDCLINPKDLIFHEIFIYDFQSPHREVFNPKPRSAIERALSKPHDYLNCECCLAEDNALSASQPATALVYQLYLESGSLINIADLWAAFRAIVSTGRSDDMEEDDEQEKETS